AYAAIDDPEPIVRSHLASSRLRKGKQRAKTPLTPRPFSWIDHLVRLEQHCLRDRQPERSRGLEVDHQLELGRLLDGEVTGLGALEDLVHIEGATPCGFEEARPIRNQASGHRELPGVSQ